ncbi:MAG: nuclear transport factor 2 family protein [Cytophagaceae bacterium]|nr:nuclear transport factor 2 family protein [Gemmatimonadaceae bacterium]
MRRVTRSTLLLLALAATSALAAQAPSSAEEREVLSVVQRMFDAMRARDTAAMQSTFHASARLVGMRPGPAGGAPVVQVLSASDFVARMGRDTRGTWIERGWEPQVRVSGTLATVWAEYDFHFGTTFSHCGVDAVQLLRTSAGWRIISIADTYVREGCPTRPPPTP